MIQENMSMIMRDHVIQIQQDNSHPHCKGDDKELEREMKNGGWTLKIIQKPPKSPDFNMLDLGFLAEIQGLNPCSPKSMMPSNSPTHPVHPTQLQKSQPSVTTYSVKLE